MHKNRNSRILLVSPHYKSNRDYFSPFLHNLYEGKGILMHEKWW